MYLETDITSTKDSVVPKPVGYILIYHLHEKNYCPGCGQSSWYVGRNMAECAFCDTALPLAAQQGIRTALMH